MQLWYWNLFKKWNICHHFCNYSPGISKCLSFTSLRKNLHMQKPDMISNNSRNYNNLWWFFFRHVPAKVVQYLIFIPILSSASTGMHEFQLSGIYNSDKAFATEWSYHWHLSWERFLQNWDFFYFVEDSMKKIMSVSKKLTWQFPPSQHKLVILFTQGKFVFTENNTVSITNPITSYTATAAR